MHTKPNTTAASRRGRGRRRRHRTLHTNPNATSERRRTYTEYIRKQIEEWMGQEGIITEDHQQACHNENEQSKKEAEPTVFDKELSKLVEKGHKPEDKGDQKKTHQQPPGREGATPTRRNPTAAKIRKTSPEKMANRKQTGKMKEPAETAKPRNRQEEREKDRMGKYAQELNASKADKELTARKNTL